MKITIKDIAKRAGVAISTASNVLNNKSNSKKASAKTRDIILQAAKDLNYTPNIMAKGLRNGRTYLLGVLFPLVSNNFLSKILQGIDDTLNKNDYSMLLCTYRNHDDFKKKISVMKSKGIDGIIAVGDNRAEYLAEYKKLNDLGIQLSFIALDVKIDGTLKVFVDGWKIGFLAGEYLANLGHKDILMVTGVMLDRTLGFANALEKRGLVFAQEKIMQKTDPFENGRSLIKKICSKKLTFTAIFAYNDVFAAGAIYEANKHKLKIPQSLSIIAVNNDPISQMTSPKITTVAQPQYEQGALAAELLIKKIKGLAETEIKILKPFIIERESCCKPPNKR